MKIHITLILVTVLIINANAALGVDVSKLFSVENYTCMKNQGISFACARGYRSFGGVDNDAIQSLKNIKQAGL